MPNLDYLKSKRGSVFHKAFESGGQVVKEFVPPVYPKPEASQEQLVALFTKSFLTKVFMLPHQITVFLGLKKV